MKVIKFLFSVICRLISLFFSSFFFKKSCLEVEFYIIRFIALRYKILFYFWQWSLIISNLFYLIKFLMLFIFCLLNNIKIINLCGLAILRVLRYVYSYIIIFLIWFISLLKKYSIKIIEIFLNTFIILIRYFYIVLLLNIYFLKLICNFIMYLLKVIIINLIFIFKKIFFISCIITKIFLCYYSILIDLLNKIINNIFYIISFRWIITLLTFLIKKIYLFLLNLMYRLIMELKILFLCLLSIYQIYYFYISFFLKKIFKYFLKNRSSNWVNFTISILFLYFVCICCLFFLYFFLKFFLNLDLFYTVNFYFDDGLVANFFNLFEFFKLKTFIFWDLIIDYYVNYDNTNFFFYLYNKINLIKYYKDYYNKLKVFKDNPNFVLKDEDFMKFKNDLSKNIQLKLFKLMFSDKAENKDNKNNVVSQNSENGELDNNISFQILDNLVTREYLFNNEAFKKYLRDREQRDEAWLNTFPEYFKQIVSKEEELYRFEKEILKIYQFKYLMSKSLTHSEYVNYFDYSMKHSVDEAHECYVDDITSHRCHNKIIKEAIKHKFNPDKYFKYEPSLAQIIGLDLYRAYKRTMIASCVNKNSNFWWKNMDKLIEDKVIDEIYVTKTNFNANKNYFKEFGETFWYYKVFNKEEILKKYPKSYVLKDSKHKFFEAENLNYRYSDVWISDYLIFHLADDCFFLSDAMIKKYFKMSPQKFYSLESKVRSNLYRGLAIELIKYWNLLREQIYIDGLLLGYTLYIYEDLGIFQYDVRNDLWDLSGSEIFDEFADMVLTEEGHDYDLSTTFVGEAEFKYDKK